MKPSIEQLKAHFRRVRDIVEYVSKAAGGCGGVRQGCSSPNPYYGQSGDLSIILCEYYGMPSGVTTPLGFLQIDTPNKVDESWRKEVSPILSLEPCYGEWREWDGERQFRSIYKDGPLGGETGPGWAVMRDTHGDALPKPTTRIEGWVTSPVTPLLYGYDEADDIWLQHIEPIFHNIISMG